MILIRSQDRKILINASELKIFEAYEGFKICAGIEVLGRYSTYENAMEVMDMIQAQIESATDYIEKSEYRDYYNRSGFVFQMPQDIDRSKELKDIISGKGLKPLNESEDGLHKVKWL